MRILQLLIMALTVLSSLAAVASTSASSSFSSTIHRARHRLRHHRHRPDRHHRQRWRTTDNSGPSASAISGDHFLEDLRRMSKAYDEMFPRSAALRQRNEALCDVEMNTVHMNTPTDEFDPPFFVETRCTNVAQYERDRGLFPLRPQTCVHDLLRCVQGYRDLHFSRRRIGAQSWQPFTRQNVPVSCDCMWPVEKYGSQRDRDEL
uniref:Spaetzle domain-containing protein n=1 Tax=Plectus sambesii TaxID=2011161 RepID=A0A914VHS0_9BILA